MYVSPHDYASYEIYFKGIYDRYMTNFFQAHLFEGNVCWDIGTERGWFTLLMANLVGNTGRVDSFEAFPPTFVKLKKNIDLNQFEWVNANNVAVSDSTGKMFFVPPTDEVTHHVDYLHDCGGVGYLTQNATPDSIEVPTISLDEYAVNHPLERLDFIKIDIEGAEYAALLGAENIIRKIRPIIAIEYNQETALRAGTSIEKLDELLDSYGYDRFTFYSRLEKLQLEKYKDVADNYAVFNVYCFPRP
jgi:FkbM family methyltransferase